MLILWVLLSEINFQKNVYTCLVLLIILNFFKLNLLFITLQNKNLSEVILGVPKNFFELTGSLRKRSEPEGRGAHD